MYRATYITSSFDFFSVHYILIILLMYHISAASSLLSRSFVSLQYSLTFRGMDHLLGFQGVDFGVNCVGEDGCKGLLKFFTLSVLQRCNIFKLIRSNGNWK